MAKWGINPEGKFIIACSHCHRKIDLVIAKRKAEMKGDRDIRCPHCDGEIATLN